MKFRTPSFLEKLVTWFMVVFLATPTSVIYAQLQPPIVIRHEVNQGSPQRSSVTNLSYYFNTNVVLGVNNLVLRNLSTNTPIDPTNFALAYDLLSNKASFTFPGLPGRSLPEGNFIASLLANTVTNPAGIRLDGNGDGQPDGAYSFGTFRYFGDWNGDRDIDFWDNYWFQRSFGKNSGDTNYDARFDFNADGVVNVTERARFDNNYFTILKPQPGIFAALVNDTGVSPWDNITSDATIAGTVIRTNSTTRFHARLLPAASLQDVTSTLATNGNYTFTSNALSQLLGGPLTNGSYTLHLETRETSGFVSATFDLPFTLESPCVFAQSNQWITTISQPTTRNSQAGLPGSVVFTNCEVVLTEGDSFVVTMERTFSIPTNAGLLAITYAGPAFDSTATNRMRDAFEAALVDTTGRPLTFTIQGAAGVAAAGDSTPQVLPASPDAFFNHSDGKSPFVAPGAVVIPSTLNPQLSTLLVDISSLAANSAKLILRLVNNDADHSTTVRITDVGFKPADATLNLAGSPPTALSLMVASSITGSGALEVTNNTCAIPRFGGTASPSNPPPTITLTPDIIGGPLTNPANGHVYYLLPSNTWSNSAAQAVILGGHLATINNAEENAWVVSNFSLFGGVPRGLWLGFTDRDLEGSFVWVSGEPITYLNWASGEPNNYGASAPGFTNESFAHIWAPNVSVPTGTWNDLPDISNLFNGSTPQFGLYGLVEVDFSNIRSLPSLVIQSPVENSYLAVSRTLLNGQASATPPNRITLVAVNSQPVDALDAAGNFFSSIEIKPGQNLFTVVATDVFNQSITNTVTVYGTTCPQNFSSLGEVSSSVTPEYGRTTFNEWTKVLYADLALRNTGTYPIRAPFYVGVTHISDPTVSLLSPDGVSADGIPYYDFSVTLANSTLNPQQSSLARTLAFRNPNKVQFTYDLVVLGQLNQPPHFTSTPRLEGVPDRPYSYDSDATDPDGDVLSYSLLTSPTGMNIQVASGLISWTPTTNQLGTHDVVIRTIDGKGGAAEQHYLLSVSTAPSNRPPYFVSTPLNAVRIGADYLYDADALDPDFDTLAYSLLVAPSNMVINPVTGLIQWGPTAAQIGDHDVTVQVSDGRGGINFQSYRVCVLPAEGNHPPIITSSPETTPTPLQLQSNLITNGDFESGNFSQCVAGPPPYFCLNNLPLGSTNIPGWNIALSLNDPGQIMTTSGLEWVKVVSVVSGQLVTNYNVDLVDSPDDYFAIDTSFLTIPGNRYRLALQAWQGGILGLSVVGTTTNLLVQRSIIEDSNRRTHSFDFTADDTVSRLSLWAIDMSRVNQTDGSAPFVDNISVSEFKPFSFTKQISAVDADGDQLSYSLVAGPANMTINSTNGLILWNATLGDIGTHAVSVMVLDGRGGSDEQSFMVTVTNALGGGIQGAVFAAGSSNDMRAGWIIFLDQNGNGRRDTSERLTITDTNGAYNFVGLVAGSHRVTVESRSGWAKTSPASGFYSVSLTAGQTVTNLNFNLTLLTNASANSNPIFVSSPATNVASEGNYLYYASAQDNDGDVPSYDLVVHPEGMLVDTNTGIVAWHPELHQLGVHEVILRVQDGRGGVALQSWQITVIVPNSAPVITTFPPGPAVVGLPYRYAVRAQDAEGQPLTFLLASNAPSGMSFDSAFSTPQSALLVWTPTLGQIGTNPVEIIVRDSQGAEGRQQFNLNVVPSAQNTAPYFTSTPRKQIRIGLPYSYRVAAADSDGDPLSFQLLSAPSGMALSNAQPPVFNSQLLAWTPTDGQFGSNFIVLQVSDGRGGTNVQQFAINVSSTLSNQAPLITSAPQVHATAEQPYEYDLQAVDADGDDLAWQLLSGPVGMSIDSQTGALRWNPTHDQLGTNTVIVQVQDTFLATDTQAYQIDVGCENRPPQITSTPPVSAQTGDLYLYATRGSDPDDDSITWSLTANPPGMTIDAATGLIRWTPATNQVGANTITLRASDGRGGIGSQTYTLYVGNQKANHAPVITSAPTFGATTDRLYTYTLRATDSDGDALTLQILSAPAGATLTPTASTPGGAQGLINWTPTSVQAGPQEFIVSARDTAGASAAQRFTVTVRANDAPIITSTPPPSAAPTVTYRYDVRATDPNGDTLSYALTQAPAGMTIDSFGRIAWTPTLAQVGTNATTVTVSDGFGGQASQSYVVTVTADTQPPVVSLELVQGLVNTTSGQWSGNLGSTVRIRVNATDNGSIANRSLRIGTQAIPLDGNGVGSLMVAQTGLFDVLGTATDGAGNTASATRPIQFRDPRATNTVFVRILAPTNDATVTSQTPIVATITNVFDLASYRVDFAPVDLVDLNDITAANPAFTSITNVLLPAGTRSIVGASLASFDPTALKNDAYVIRVYAEDVNGTGWYEPVVVGVSGNLKFGEFRLEFTDLVVPVAGIPITVSRVYDTRDAKRVGDFGYGWSLGVQGAQIRETLHNGTLYNGSKVYLNTPDGRRVGFTAYPTNIIAFGFVFSDVAFRPDPGVFEKLEINGERQVVVYEGDFLGGLGDSEFNPDNYRLTTKDGLVFEYNQNSGLQRVTDPNGNHLEYTRDGIFHYSAGNATPDQQVPFVRDASGRIKEIITPDGSRLAYTFDTSGDLRRFTDQLSNVTQYAYSTARQHYLTNIIDSLGRQALRIEYDAQGRLKSITDANGNPISQEFDSTTKLARFVDGNGHTNLSQFDNNGNETMKAVVGISTNYFTYDANNNLLRGVDGRGFATNFTYDASGNVTSITDALSNRTSIAYNSLNKPTAVTNALGQVLRLNYDSSGKLLNVLNNAGQQTIVTRDSQGRVASLTDAAGHTTSFDYMGGCSCGKPGKVTNADGSFRLMEYDSFGNTTRLVNELGAETLSFYNSNGQLQWTRDPLTNYTQFFYNGTLLTNIVDALGRSTRFQYDSLNRTNAIIDAQGGVVRFEYDNKGNRTKVIDPVTNITAFVYDAGNRLVQQIDPLGHTNFFAYDAAGNRVEAIDRNGRKRTFSYDSLNRMTNELWWEGTNVVRNIEFAFNKLGVQTLAKDPAARYDYTYDLLNRLERVTQSSVPGQPDFSLAYTYTALGQVASVTDNYGVQVGSAYDTRNRLARRTWQGTGVDPARVDFAYDVTGNRTRTDRYADLAATSRVGFTTNAYNRVGIVTNITHLGPAAQVLAKYDYNFDAANQITRWAINSQLSTFNYDLTGQLTNALNTAQPNESFRFDANGNRVGAQTSGSYVVGGNNQILSDGTNRYAYDFEGNMTARSNTVTGVLTTYQWDHRNRLLSVLDYNPSGVVTQTVAFVYNAMNRRLAKTVNGTVQRFLYNQDDSWADLNSGNVVTARYLHGARIDELLARQRTGDGRSWYLTDHLGTVRDIANAAGSVVAHVDYSSFGQVLGASNMGVMDRFGFTGRELDEETKLSLYRARYYSSQIGRFVSADAFGFWAGDLNLYRYVANQPNLASDPSGHMAFLESSLIRGAFVGALVGGAGAAGQPGATAKSIGLGATVGAVIGLVGGSLSMLGVPTLAGNVMGQVLGCQYGSNSGYGCTFNEVSFAAAFVTFLFPAITGYQILPREQVIVALGTSLLSRTAGPNAVNSGPLDELFRGANEGFRILRMQYGY